MPQINLTQLRGAVLRKKQALIPATVPAGQNFAVLTIPGGQSLQPVSIDNSEELGVVAAVNPTFGVHSLAQVSSSSLISPKNLARLRLASDHTPVMCETKRIYGLIQCEPGMVTGDYFNNTNKRLQISFVVQSFSYPGYELCEIEHIEGKTLNFEYITRISRAEAEAEFVVPIFDEPLLGTTGPEGPEGPEGPAGPQGETGPPGSAEDALTLDNHKNVRQLIHFIGQGPAEGFATGAYRENLPSADPFPTAIVWWESSEKLKKIVEKLITYDGNKIPQTTQWKMYDVDGSTIVTTVTDTYSYSGVIETNRTRTIA